MTGLWVAGVLVCCVLWLLAFGIWLWMLRDYMCLRDRFYHKWKVAFLVPGALVLLIPIVALVMNA